MTPVLILAGLLAHPMCAASANLHEAWTIPDIEERLTVCSDIARKAEEANLPVEVIAELAWSESRWEFETHPTSGCAGPLQASPRWWCPTRKVAGCDLVAAGFRAFVAYTDKHPKLEVALCHYKSGNVCQPQAMKGALRVVEAADRLRFAVGGRT